MNAPVHVLGPFSSITSPDVSSLIGRYSTSNFDCDAYAEYHINFPLVIKKSIGKRQAEFFAGRYIAKLLLQQQKSVSHFVDIGEHGKPIFPSGFCGSITHSDDGSNGIVLCLIAKEQQIKAIGVDCQHFIKQNTSRVLQKYLIGPHERDIWQQVSDSSIVQNTLAFSAKESIFKARFSAYGQTIAFDALSLSNARKNKLRFVLHNTQDHEFIHVFYRAFDTFVVTWTYTRTYIYGE